MTSGPFAGPNTPTPGPSDSTTAGAETPTATAPMDTGGQLGLPDLGSLNADLNELLSLSGMPEESTQDIAHGITLLVRAWFLEWLASSISDTQKQPIDCKKQQSTPTSES